MDDSDAALDEDNDAVELRDSTGLLELDAHETLRALPGGGWVVVNRWTREERRL